MKATHELRCRAAGLVLGGTTFAITGASAATLMGVPLLRPAEPVEVLVPEDQRVTRRAGVLVRRVVDFPEGDPANVADVPVVPPERMALDLTRGQSLGHAVARLDAACRAGLVDPERLSAWLVSRSCAGVVLAREALTLVDPRAESVPESLVRVALVRAGLQVEPQHVVRVRGRFVARVDLAVVEARVAVEYDGAWHALRESLVEDRRRLAALREAGWSVVHVTADDLARLSGVVDAVRREVAQRGDLP